MIRDDDIEERSRTSKFERERHVFVGRLRIAGRVVVEEHDAQSMQIECESNDVARAHEGAVERPHEHVPLLNHAITRVEEEHAEVLLHVERVACREAWTGDVDMEPLSLIGRTEEDSPREFHRCAETDGVGRANA